MANKKAPRVGVRSSRSASIDLLGFGQGDENNPAFFVDLLPSIRKKFLDLVGDGSKVSAAAEAVRKEKENLTRHLGSAASSVALADAQGKLTDAQTFNKTFSKKDAATFRELAADLTRARKLTGLTDKEREADIRDTTAQLRDFLNTQTKLANDRITANTQVGSELLGKVDVGEENIKVTGLSGFLGPLNEAFEVTQSRPGDVPPGSTDPTTDPTDPTDPTAPGTVPAGDTSIKDNPGTTGGDVLPGDTQVVIDAKLEAARKRGRRFKTGGGLLGLLIEPETRKKAILGN